MRLIDFLKQRASPPCSPASPATARCLAESQVGVSSLMDSWLLLTNVAHNGERTRTLQVLKSRGMPHSNQVREFVFTDDGVDLVDVYLHGDQVLTGTARAGSRSAGACGHRAAWARPRPAPARPGEPAQCAGRADRCPECGRRRTRRRGGFCHRPRKLRGGRTGFAGALAGGRARQPEKQR